MREPQGTIEKGGINPYPPSTPQPYFKPVGQIPREITKAQEEKLLTLVVPIGKLLRAERLDAQIQALEWALEQLSGSKPLEQNMYQISNRIAQLRAEAAK